MSQPSDSYSTLAGTGTAEQKIQRSTFLAFAAPAADEAAARSCVDELRRRYHDARHVCSAWRLGFQEPWLEARHDDGEPPGSAGEPILQAIRGEALTATVVAVVRYFGGIKLGTGGLARAYGSTAAAALAAAPRREVRLGRYGRLEFAYAQQKTLSRLLVTHGGRLDAETYGPTVRWRVWLPQAAWDGFARAVREATAGQVMLQAAAPPGQTG
ncbi:MAG: YigZ family protein [Candidatus Krumholzibacteria bacterium]|jgi:uncharacterized YigZ family protein|nr:YigZ family protein [Candidatus Krumholzibacteria bacterium]